MCPDHPKNTIVEWNFLQRSLGCIPITIYFCDIEDHTIYGTIKRRYYIVLFIVSNNQLLTRLVKILMQLPDGNILADHLSVLYN